MRFLKHAMLLLFAMLASPVMAADEIVVYSARYEQLAGLIPVVMLVRRSTSRI